MFSRAKRIIFSDALPPDPAQHQHEYLFPGVVHLDEQELGLRNGTNRRLESGVSYLKASIRQLLQPGRISGTALITKLAVIQAAAGYNQKWRSPIDI